MRGKRITCRERYFADNEAVRVAAEGRKGCKTVYRYTGLWKAWDCSTGTLRKRKLVIAVGELVAAALYLSCALVDSPVNSSRLASGFGLLSLIPGLLEISGVLRFALAGEYVKELSMEEIDKSIRYGCPLRAALVSLSGLAGMSEALIGASAAVRDGLLTAGILASASLSLVIWRRYRTLLVNTFRNADGKPGGKI